MYDERNGEKFPSKKPELEQRGEYADVWEDANMMEDAPEFQGEDPYNPSNVEEKFNEVEEKINEQVDGPRETEAEKTSEKSRGGAKSLTSYGLDTASRMYGLDTVLKTIEETDETDRDAINPIASIYSRLVPNPDERKNLYHEIGKELTETDFEEEKDTDPNDAIRQMKILLNSLENDDRFASVRERAANEGKDVVSYITTGKVNPTLSNFFEGVEGASGKDVEEILDEIEEEEKAKETEELIEEITEDARN